MKQKLSFKEYIYVASMLFGMFFGAGNLIFPVYMGQVAGRNMWAAVLGFLITGVGLPLLGVAALGISRSNGLFDLSHKVGRPYAFFFTCALYLTIGPFFAIPRCATTSFTVGLEQILPHDDKSWLYLLLFSLLFFAVTLVLSLRPGKILTYVGKVLTPCFLVFLAIMVFVTILHPTTSIGAVEPQGAYAAQPFFTGFLEGYNTMDAIAGLAFGIVVIDIIRSMGVTDDSDVAKDVLSSGLLTSIPMIVIYVTTILMGTQSRGLFETSENGGIALTQIAGHYLGGVGLFILAFTITFACLKTSIGLVTACAETFSKMTNGKISYRSWAILFTVFSFAVSNIGLSAIIEYSIPMLMLIYPPAIALILLAFLGKFFAHDRTVYIATMIGTWAAAIFDCMKTLPAPVQTALHLDTPIAFAAAHLPLFDKNLGWLLPAVIGFAAGMAIRASRK